MHSTGDPDREEVARLARELRGALGRHARAGAWSAPGGPSARPEHAPADADADADATPREPAAAAAASPEPAGAAAAPPPRADDDGRPARVRLTLADIRAELGECTRCKLSRTRDKIVFGVGDGATPLMFVGEAPGAEEDRRGEPFVGRAGELLDKMIEAMGWTRDTVYITNVLKCRPPGNRNPEPDEVAACQPFLEAQIASIAPRILVTLGRPAANAVLGTSAPISALRGRFHEHRGLKVMPTFHPAFLLRQPDRKRDAWSDLKQVMAELERLGVASPRPPRG